jgi:hypothetical protein
MLVFALYQKFKRDLLLFGQQIPLINKILNLSIQFIFVIHLL